jgi:hypothetical protein
MEAKKLKQKKYQKVLGHFLKFRSKIYQILKVGSQRPTCEYTKGCGNKEKKEGETEQRRRRRRLRRNEEGEGRRRRRKKDEEGEGKTYT